MIAIIKTGGKQYLIQENQELKVELTDFDEKSKELVFDQVLLTSNDQKTTVGEPLVKDAKVTAEVLGEVRGKKILVVKHHPKKHYRRTQGHRQNYLHIKIKKIEVK